MPMTQRLVFFVAQRLASTLGNRRPGPPKGGTTSAKPRSSRARRGFTLVELLVVIAIIGILIGLLMPAVQSARESGRRTQCANNVTTLAKACLAHEEAQRHLPEGGWGYLCLGVPGRGFDPKTQPGGWIYNILPNIDQDPLWSGVGSTSGSVGAMSQLVTTALPVLNCPTRRRAALYTYVKGTPYGLSAAPAKVARSDYAMNGNYPMPTPPLPLTELNPPKNDLENGGAGPMSMTFSSSMVFVNNGVTGRAWWVDMAQITDGPANTYLLGEKMIPSDHYTDGYDYGDDDNAYIGGDCDVLRTFIAPAPDQPSGNTNHDTYNRFAFGSAHVTGFHMAFCDAHVKYMPFSIDPQVHLYLCNRCDAQAPDLSGL